MMNISRFVAGALLAGAIPALAQPDVKPANGLPYPLISLQDATRLSEMKQPVSLHLRDVTLAQALDELQKQSGVALDLSNSPPQEFLAKKLSVDINTRSLAEAFRSVLDGAGVQGSLARQGQGEPLSVRFGPTFIIPNQSPDAPRSGTPAFQIQAFNFNLSSSRSVVFGKSPVRDGNSGLKVTLGYDVDPQLVVAGPPTWQIKRAEDDKGRSLKTSQDNFFNHLNSFSSGYSGNGSTGQSTVPLGVAPDDSQKLAHLDGVAVFVLATKSDDWTVQDALNAKNLAHTFQNPLQSIRVTINSIRQVGNAIDIDLEATGQANATVPAEASIGRITQALRLVDATGQELWMNRSHFNSDNSSASFQARYAPRPDFGTRGAAQKPGAAVPATPELKGPVKLIIEMPTEFVQTQVPFSFSNLPLP